MALNPILASLDGLDENTSNLYVEREEGGETVYVLDVTPTDGWELGNTRKLKRALELERAKAKVSDRLGDEISPGDVEALRDEIATLKDDAKRSRKAKASTSDDASNAKIDELIRLHQEKEKKWQAAESELDGEVDRLLRVKEARDALKAGGFEGAEDVMLPHLLGCLRTSRDARTKARYVEVFNPDDGTPRIGGTGGEPMTPTQRVAEYLENPQFQRLADGAGKTGGGLNGRGTETVNKAGNLDASLPAEERLTRIHEANYAQAINSAK